MSANVWTAGNLALSPWSGLVPLVAVGFAVLHILMGVFVGLARRKYRIAYPSLYAVPGTPRDYSTKDGASSKLVEGESPNVTESEAYAFNCVQRGHQNFLENAPMIVLLLLVSWPFPIVSGVAGFVQLVGRYLYFIGRLCAMLMARWMLVVSPLVGRWA